MSPRGTESAPYLVIFCLFIPTVRSGCSKVITVPILTQEVEISPADLLECAETGMEEKNSWWAVYTMSRREKEFMRRINKLGLSFYCPMIEKKYRSPTGRSRTSYLPLFTNYVFLYGDQESRYLALTSNCVSQILPVPDSEELTQELRQIYRLIDCGVPVTIEEKLQPGTRVRVRSGSLSGQEGVIVERRGRRHLLVAVSFLQQGACVEIEDYAVEAI